MEYLSAEKQKKIKREVKEILTSLKGRHSSDVISDNLPQLIEYFRQLRTYSPIELVEFLNQQLKKALEVNTKLFDSPELLTALWGLSHAYNLTSYDHIIQQLDNSGSESIILPSYLKGNKERVASIFPKRLAWDSTAHIQDDVVASMTSPITNAWIYKNDLNQYTDIIIVGRGPSWIHTQITNSAFAVSIALAPKNDHYILNGVIRLTAREEGKEDLYRMKRQKGFLQFLPNFFFRPSGYERIHMIEIPHSADEAMAYLKRILDDLERETGLVKVHVIFEKTLHAINQLMVETNAEANDSDSAFLWGGKRRFEFDSLVTSFQYEQIPSLKGVLSFSFSQDLLETVEFKGLRELYLDSMIGNMISDAECRAHFYQEVMDRAQSEMNWYRDLPKTEKDELEPVIVNQEFDFELAIAIQITGTSIKADMYYTVNVKYHFESAKSWLARIEDLLKLLKPLIGSPSAPLVRLVTTRLIDCALRNVDPSDEPIIKQIFRKWKSQIQPILFIEWRKTLSDIKISEEDLFNHHTFFNCLIQEKDNTILCIANTLFDSKRSTVLFDRRRKIPVYYDGTRYATYRKREKQQSDFSFAELVNESLKSKIDKEKLKTLILDQLKANPEKVAQDMINPWLSLIADNSEAFDRLKESAIEKNLAFREALRALKWLNELAFHSAEEAIKTAEHHGTPNAGIFVIKALKACQLGGFNMDSLAQFHSETSFMLQAHQRHMAEANRLDPELVQKFLDFNELSFTHKTSGFELPSAAETGATSYERALEACQLYLQFNQAISQLNLGEETQRSLYAKVGSAIEKAWAPKLAYSSDSLNSVLEPILGKKRK